ncbi:unnamed protein product [Schistosoma mattheei]|uniref:Uncharacterized protein n=1 Tax=Schistosoma mattheei TaxID=31246 RepID=A0A183NTE8_9TREM|nr:unnamed protein product [Schistosoma mattheei]
MTGTRKMKYDVESSEAVDDSFAENTVLSVSKLDSPTSLNLAFDSVSPNPKYSCPIVDIYAESGCRIEDEAGFRQKEAEKIELEIRELQLRWRLLESTPKPADKVRKSREITELPESVCRFTYRTNLTLVSQVVSQNLGELSFVFAQTLSE